VTWAGGLAATSLGATLTAQDSDKVRDTVKRLETVLGEVDARLGQMSAVQSDAETTAQALRAENLMLRQQLTVAMTQLQERARERDAARIDLAAARDKLHAGERAATNLQQELAQRRQRDDEPAGRLARLEQELAAATAAQQVQLRASAERERAHEHAAAQLAAANQELAAQLAAAATARAELAATLEQTRADVRARAAALTQARARADSIAADNEQLRAALDEQRAAPPAAAAPSAPLHVHHHGSGHIILQIPARPVRGGATSVEPAGDKPRRIDV
jgi:chromosome segregation ATPase